MLQWALRYRSIGFSVIPLKNLSKEPLIAWAEFQKRIASEEEIKEWFQKWPNANLGIVTGSISNLVVVDLDGIAGLQSQKDLKLGSTVVALTGNGKHLWYKLINNGTAIQNVVKLVPGLDIRGEGGYVVAPPSIHENGRRYRWLKPFVRGFLPEFPNLLIAAKPINTVLAAKPISSFGDKKEEGWIAKALEEMKDGNIDITLTSVLGRLRHDGYSASDAKTLLSPHANLAGATPGHLEEKIENVWNRYESKREFIQAADFRQSNSRIRLLASLVIHSPTNPDSIEQFEQRILESRQQIDGLKTGYSKLDQMLEGGLKSSRLFTVAARTGVGKTNWLLGAIRSLCRSGKRVLLFSTEMPYEQIWQRYIAALDSSEEFKQHQFYVCDSFAPNLEKVEEAVNAIKPDVFVFDHINHVAEDPRELGTFVQGLNYLRRKYDCAGIMSAQLNRSADWIDLKTGEKVTPRMSMIKGSGTIEQASSRVLLLSETRVLPEYTEIVGNLDKNDNGMKGLIHFGLFNNPWRMEEL